MRRKPMKKLQPPPKPKLTTRRTRKKDMAIMIMMNYLLKNRNKICENEENGNNNKGK